MFERARLKLTAWYLLIIMLISILFSIAFYHASTREIERIISRIEFRQQFPDREIPDRMPPRDGPTPPSLEDLQDSKRQILTTLALVNAGIFIIAGFAGYFLAGRTLKPIKLMIDEQNQFISNASHELRTPLATLRAEMEGSLLEKNISDKDARELIRSNLEELSSLQDLTNDLLQLAQINNSSHQKVMQKLKLPDIINSALKKVRPLAKKKQINIELKTENCEIEGDKASLTELFVILLDNAIKYSVKNSMVIISATNHAKKVIINVSDQGIGISEKDLPHIFERFYRADSSRSKTEGYGLGLSIARKIILEHDGVVSAKSKPNEGTTFSISLPRITS